MLREKSEIEKSETYREEASRLRYALHVIHGMATNDEIKAVAWKAMRGELHGHEMPKSHLDTISQGPLTPMSTNR